MTYKKMHVRSGLTAIAAVLALSSTPLGAQETTAPPDPVVETPSEPAPAADPLAPDPAAAEPAATEAEPATTAPPATTRRTPARARTTAANRAPSQAPRTAAPVSPPPASEAVAEPVAALPPPAAPLAEPAPPPAVEEPAPASYDLMADESLPIAAGAGLGLLLLGGIGLAIGRRRQRRLELDHIRANQQFLAEHPPQPMPAAPMPNDNEPAFIRASQPAMAATAPASAVRTDAPRTKLPNGFDLSRFGPHVRAAYIGPTPDNPSLSLKYRLRRAAAMDQRAKLDAEARPEAARPAVHPEPAKQPMPITNDQGFMLRRAASGQAARPAFQK